MFKSCEFTLIGFWAQASVVHTFVPSSRRLVRPGLLYKWGHLAHASHSPSPQLHPHIRVLTAWSHAMLPVNLTPASSSLLKTLERQKMSLDSLKRPLMMAALNGLYVARMPVPESPAEDGAKTTDERVRIDKKTLFNFQILAMT